MPQVPQLEELAHELKGVFIEESQVVETFLGALRREQQVLTRADYDGIIQSTKEKETLLLKQELCRETQRKIWSRMRAVAPRLPSRGGLQAIKDLVSAPLFADLEAFARDLDSLRHAAFEFNSRNAELLQHSRRCVQGSLDLIRYGLLRQKPTYQPNGKINAASGAISTIHNRG